MNEHDEVVPGEDYIYIYIIASSCMMVEFNHQFVVFEW